MRFDAAIRTILTFYAALIGFGLRHILEIPGPLAIGQYKLSFFLMAIFLFLRFLLGAGNHLWVEYVWNYRNPKQPGPKIYLFFGLDLGFITMFGIFATIFGYVTNPDGVFSVTFLFLSVVIVWGLADLLLRWWLGSMPWGHWHWWLVLNAIQLLVLFLIWHNLSDSNLRMSWWAIVSFLSLIVDCWIQFRQLHRLPAELIN